MSLYTYEYDTYGIAKADKNVEAVIVIYISNEESFFTLLASKHFKEYDLLALRAANWDREGKLCFIVKAKVYALESIKKLDYVEQLDGFTIHTFYLKSKSKAEIEREIETSIRLGELPAVTLFLLHKFNNSLQGRCTLITETKHSIDFELYIRKINV